MPPAQVRRYIRACKTVRRLLSQALATQRAGLGCVSGGALHCVTMP